MLSLHGYRRIQVGQLYLCNWVTIFCRPIWKMPKILEDENIGKCMRTFCVLPLCKRFNNSANIASLASSQCIR